MPDIQEQNTIEDFLRKLIESGGQEGPLERAPVIPPRDRQAEREAWGGGGVRGLPQEPEITPHPGGPLTQADLNVLGAPQTGGQLPPPPPALENAPAGQPGGLGGMYGGHPNPYAPMEPTGPTPPFNLTLPPGVTPAFVGNQDVGVAPVPPPIDTSIPVEAPTQATPPAQAAQAEPPAQAEPTPPAIPSRDPNELLLQAYRPKIMELAMEARKRDIERGTGLGAQAVNYGLLAQWGLPGVQAIGAAGLQKALTGEIHGPTLERAGLAAQAMGKGQLDSEKMDPDSQFSEGQRIALMGSPMTNEWANRAVAQGEFKTPFEAKHWMYNKLKTLHGAAMSSYMETIMKGGDFSKQEAERKFTDVMADKNSWEAKQIRLAFETDQALKAALSDASHPATRYLKGILRQLDTRGYDSTPGIEKMNGLEAGSALQLMQPALTVLQRRVEQQLQTEHNRVVVPGVLEFEASRVNNGIMDVDILPAGANAQDERVRFGNTQGALQTALEVREEATRLSKLGAGVKLGSRGAALGAKLRALNSQLNAVGNTQGQKDFDALYGTLEKGDVPIGAVTANTDKLLNSVFGPVATQAAAQAPRIKRKDVDAAIGDPQDMPLPQGPALGYEKKRPNVSPVSTVRIRDPYNKGEETWANKQIIGGKYYYWLSNGKQVILNPKLRPQTDDPTKFEVTK